MSSRQVPIRVDEFGFLLDLILEAMNELGLAHLPAGMNAGRYLGKICPLPLERRDLRSVITAMDERMRPDLEIRALYEIGKATLEVVECPVRNICLGRDIQLGGKLCLVFHSYLAGLVSEYLGRMANVEMLRFGVDRCQLCIDES